MEVSYPKTTTSLGSAFGVQLDNRKLAAEKGGRGSGGCEQGERGRWQERNKIEFDISESTDVKFWPIGLLCTLSVYLKDIILIYIVLIWKNLI